MSRPRPFSLTLPDGDSLHGLLDPASQPGPRPTVVICHGFKGFLDWGFFPPLARLLAERGFTVVRFNFTGSGMRPGDELVTDLEAFAGATPGADRDELLALLDRLAEIAPGAVDRERIGVVGHSRGGGAALLAAASDDWRERLGALVTWAAVSTYDRHSEEEKRQWRAGGSLPVVNARTGQELEISATVLADLEARAGEYDLLAAAARRAAPWLLVHGADDETVPVGEARRLQAAARPPAELEVIDGGSHTFGAQHPFAGPTGPLIETFNHTQRWLRRHLCGQ